MSQGLKLRYFGVYAQLMRVLKYLRVYILIFEFNIFGNFIQGMRLPSYLRFSVPWYASIVFGGLFQSVRSLNSRGSVFNV